MGPSYKHMSETKSQVLINVQTTRSPVVAGLACSSYMGYE